MRSAPDAEVRSSARVDDLLLVARDSVSHGLQEGRPLPVDPEAHPPPLRELRACFVTLRIAGVLRGCTGSLEAMRPLVMDVAHNAFSSAFRDPRFSPVCAEELPRLEFSISILGPPDPIHFTSPEDLVSNLEPGRDGVILEVARRRTTFLPQVWKDIPDPQRFLAALKTKAGLEPDEWPTDLRVFRYAVESIPSLAE